MDFKEIIKQEWEKEFPNVVYSYEESFTSALDSLLTNICVRVWNEAIDKSSDTLFDCQIGTELEEAQLYAIEKLKLHEQGTDTTRT